ncbi:FMN-binding negative transcriptional regulator [Gracilibacillus ureilyticus]|uniref:FMN-binding negative transcriptional regulator n=1 Tax=Gracilibacillus ureilyticus TaxID=531814 RepID=UPI000B7D47CD
MARANPHWKKLDEKEVLVVFSGPHAYISPTWYMAENAAPTWNYSAVHVYGRIKLINNKEKLLMMLKKTVNFYEAAIDDPWEVPLESEFINALINGIVAFEIVIDKAEGKWKLSQNHSVERQKNVINRLKKSNAYDSLEIANLMEQNLKGGERNEAAIQEYYPK